MEVEKGSKGPYHPKSKWKVLRFGGVLQSYDLIVSYCNFCISVSVFSYEYLRYLVDVGGILANFFQDLSKKNFRLASVETTQKHKQT